MDFPEQSRHGQTNPLTAIEHRLCERLCEQAMRRIPRLPDFSVVVWLRKTDEFTAFKAELLGAAATEPYESTEYQGMVDFHWSAANLPEAKRLADALKWAARHPELVLANIMSRVDGVDSISIKDARRTERVRLVLTAPPFLGPVKSVRFCRG
jgi:hypothetical protein